VSARGRWFLVLPLLLWLASAGRCDAQGFICAVGGGGEDYNAWSDAPYGWIVQHADSQRIILLSANTESNWMPAYLRSLGADSVFNFRIASRTVADDSATYRAIRACHGVFIKGGDQWNYVSMWNGTLTEQAIREVYQSGGVVAGTSAGAAVLGEIVFDARYSSPVSRALLRNPRSTGLTLTTDFLSLVPDVLFDSHFTVRGRFGRLLAMMASFQSGTGRHILGIGLDAETALCIGPDGIAEVMGAGSVTFYRAGPGNRLNVAQNQPLVFTDVQCDMLVAGYRYDLASHQVSTIPPGAVTPGPGAPAPTGNSVTLFGDVFPAPAGISAFLASAGGPAGRIAVITSPAGIAAGTRFADTLRARGVDSVTIVALDSLSAADPVPGAAVEHATGLLFAGGISERFPSDADSSTAVGGALHRRIHAHTAVAFASQDCKLASVQAVFRTELEEEAAELGKLILGRGIGAFRNLAVMPLIFESDVYDENRTAGLPWGMAMTDGKTGIFLDEGGTCSIDTGGVIRSTGPTPAVILDATGVTAVGYSTYRHTGSIGPRQSTAMVGARLHVIAGDVGFDAMGGTIVTGVDEEPGQLPAGRGLLWNYPNPFNAATTIGWDLMGGRVQLRIVDMLGREVLKLAGPETRAGGGVLFDGSGLASGVYLAELQAAQGTITHKLLLLR
jgi:cyanophycinase